MIGRDKNETDTQRMCSHPLIYSEMPVVARAWQWLVLGSGHAKSRNSILVSKMDDRNSNTRTITTASMVCFGRKLELKLEPKIKPVPLDRGYKLIAKLGTHSGLECSLCTDMKRSLVY